MIKPLKDYLLLRPVEASENASGLYVPEDTTAKIQKGEVVAVGPYLLYHGGSNIMTGSLASGGTDKYYPGDVVLYSVYGANELRVDGKKLFLVPDKEVWAIDVKEK
jgi:co-chaperonin GroES (HSP10)